MSRPMIEIHPAATLFPMMSAEEFDGLKADISKHGQRESITLWKGMLLDGRNRLRACEELGIEPEFGELDDATDPFDWVISFNLHRRHLEKGQRAIIAAKCRELYEQQAKERMLAGKGLDPSANLRRGRASDHAAKAVGVSGRSVDMAGKVLASGNQELITAVEHGSMSLNAAHRKLTEPERIVYEPTPKVELIELVGELRKTLANFAEKFGDDRLDVFENVVMSELQSKLPPIGSDGRPKVKNPASTTAMQFATIAILQLKGIKDDNPDATAAFTKVDAYICNRLKVMHDKAGA